MVCLNHPDTEAAAKCCACGKPLCAECLLTFDGRHYKQHRENLVNGK